MKKLRELRKQEGITMAQLAKEIGVSMHSVFRWELGKTSPTAKELVLLARRFNVTPNELLGVGDEKSPA